MPLQLSTMKVTYLKPAIEHDLGRRGIVEVIG
jgi:hypothetical protein